MLASFTGSVCLAQINFLYLLFGLELNVLCLTYEREEPLLPCRLTKTVALPCMYRCSGFLLRSPYAAVPVVSPVDGREPLRGRTFRAETVGECSAGASGSSWARLWLAEEGLERLPRAAARCHSS